MKKIIFTLLLAIFFGSLPMLHASEAIASLSLQLKGIDTPVIIEKLNAADGISLKISGNSDNLLFDSGIIGSENKLFVVADQATGLGTFDFDGDGNVEILASAFYGPKASALYVYRFDPASKKFSPVRFLNSSDPELSTDFMTSDLRQEDGQDMVVKADGSIVALGLIYPAKPDETPVQGLYTWKFSNGEFKLIDKKAVTAD
ncbi:MAG TPA: hypothetical protein PLM07_13410 [Candidatus Rifleibacterium sp.]|nr:hypothetical protein [Candidatus Rifleibacterium sp.]HPT46883.1 hypothetical protein [Candidatus Rifleibacterium sp.]